MNITILLKLVELFTIMFLGYFVVVAKIIKKEGIKYFSNLIFYITMPAMIISSMVKSVNIDVKELPLVITIAFILYGFLIAISFVLPKLLKIDQDYIGLYRFMAVFGNVGFIGFPVILVILGKEALFYAAIINIPYNLFAFTVGVYFITMDTDKKGPIQVKSFLNPALVATMIGLVLFISQIKLPAFLANLASSLGDITTPLSLIVVGGSLYGVKLKAVLKKKTIFIYSMIKLLILPTVFAFVLSAFDIKAEIAAVAIIIVAMPFGANTVILSQEYHGHVVEASEAVVVSTLLIGLTLPYILFLIDFLF